VCSTALSVVSCDPSDSCHIDSVLGGIIQPLLQSCRLGGQALQQAEMAIFMLNNVSVLQVRGDGMCGLSKPVCPRLPEGFVCSHANQPAVPHTRLFLYRRLFSLQCA
jgi:hypothetical protein